MTVGVHLIQIFIIIVGLVIQVGMMLLLAFASGLVGDMYHEDVIRSLRHQMSSEPRKEVRAVVSGFSCYIYVKYIGLVLFNTLLLFLTQIALFLTAYTITL